MELDELKNRWSTLEEQLKKQEILNEKLIREIRQSKSGPLRFLINYGYFGMILWALVLGLIVYIWILNYYGPLKTGLFTYMILFLVAIFPFGIYNIRLLKKIDFTQSVGQNIQLLQTYKINVKKQLLPILSGAIIMFIWVIIVCLQSPNMETWRWVAIGIAIPVGGILGYLEYKKIYKAKTEAILKSLEELKELEE